MSLVDNAKDIYELVKKSATIEVQEKLMGLREEALTLQEENLSLKKRVRDLEEAAEKRVELQIDGEMYWRVKQGGQREGPFCTRCHDTKSQLVHLRKDYASYDWYCLECKTGYGKCHQQAYTPLPAVPSRRNWDGL
ncbi:MAG: hypothetical protein HZA88_00920 [Verrucomicrobia bacterium]|nr:hypothetical protein [Verrucomicrobiota bacterium]